MTNEPADAHDLGFVRDRMLIAERLVPARVPEAIVTRRRVLGLFAAAGAALLAACSSSKTTGAQAADSSAPAAADTAAPADTTGAAVAATDLSVGLPAEPGPGGPPQGPSDGDAQPIDGSIPQETAGPFPGDGTNGPDALHASGAVRSDITTSIGSAAKIEGVAFTIALSITDVAGRPLPDAHVYLWHCDREGRYSMYSQGVESETFLRGVQRADKNGVVIFTSIYPGCYAGRWPHVHYEVFADADALSAGTSLAVSQLALPKATSDAVYATSGYEASVTNLSQITIESDNVFADGVERETPTMTGDAKSGLKAMLMVPVRVP